MRRVCQCVTFSPFCESFVKEDFRLLNAIQSAGTKNWKQILLFVRNEKAVLFTKLLTRNSFFFKPVSNFLIDESNKIGFRGVTGKEIWLGRPANSQRPATRFLREHMIPVICIKNLEPGQSGRLLQSHTLMERCRGELLIWSRRKKKWNIFPVVWTTHRTRSWDETPGSLRLRRERDKRRRSRTRVAETERSGAMRVIEKRERDGDKQREWNGKRAPAF